MGLDQRVRVRKASSSQCIRQKRPEMGTESHPKECRTKTRPTFAPDAPGHGGNAGHSCSRVATASATLSPSRVVDFTGLHVATDNAGIHERSGLWSYSDRLVARPAPAPRPRVVLPRRLHARTSPRPCRTLAGEVCGRPVVVRLRVIGLSSIAREKSRTAWSNSPR